MVRKIFTFYINDVLLFKCTVPGQKGLNQKPWVQSRPDHNYLHFSSATTTKCHLKLLTKVTRASLRVYNIKNTYLRVYIIHILLLYELRSTEDRSRWPCHLKHKSAACRFLRSRVRMQLKARMFVSCVFRLSCR